MPDMTTGWSGSWVSERLGITVAGERSGYGVGPTDLVGLALRRNPRRVHLLVSTVLGKHLPTDPRLVYACGLMVAGAVGARLGDRVENECGPLLRLALTGDDGAIGALRRRAGERRLAHPEVAVVGFAETATGLGQTVADGLGAGYYLHSTRRRTPGSTEFGGFSEDHSHAPQHLLLPRDPSALRDASVIVLVDDEVSTGRTAAGLVRALRGRCRAVRYLLACLLDTRSAADAAELAAAGIEVVTLASGSVRLPDTAAAEATRLVGSLDGAGGARSPGGRGTVSTVDLHWPEGVPDGGRHGIRAAERDAIDAAVRSCAQLIDARLEPDEPVLILGTEELMYVPLRIADALAVAGRVVRFSTTTRSPALAVDHPGYAIRSAIQFPSSEDGGQRFAYNLAGAPATVVVVADSEAGSLRALADAVRSVAHRVLLATLSPGYPPPLRGPTFSSYAPDEVGWLLTDLSDARLEAPTGQRETAIRSGAHYAESLPIEYQPGQGYLALFDTSLAAVSGALATAVGTVTEIVLAERSAAGPPVLVSLARGGTPVGILMRRWARLAHGIDLCHYAISIVRGRGIDTRALGFLAETHDPASIVFVDGWTGKGAIAKELAESLRLDGNRFCSDIAVLADPGRCVRTFGTREDFLIPSACLNSTVSGLVSRTVLNPELLGHDDYHGAKFYSELAVVDHSARFLDAVSAEFSAVAADVAGSWRAVAAAEREPTWSGWDAVTEIAAAYGITDLNLVKPGVGETTRVLLRRVPWQVLISPGQDLPHIRMLAGERGVPVIERAGMPYACVGLIHPGASHTPAA